MTALHHEIEALSAQLTPLATPQGDRRHAGVIACSQARTRDEATLFLDMLGLLPATPAPATAAPGATARPASPPVRQARPALPAPLVVAASSEPAGTLTRSDAEAIRRRWSAGGITAHQLAAEYQLDQATVEHTIQHGTWTQGAPVAGVCVGCDRAMVTQRAYRQDPRWREAGFVRVGARGRCNSCYAAWHHHERQNAQPQDTPPPFTASKVRVTPLYPVLCAECGLVGEAPDTREAARQLREQHIQFHRRQQPAGQPRPRGHREVAA